MQLAVGQNSELSETVWTFTAGTAPPIAVYALLIAAGGRATPTVVDGWTSNAHQAGGVRIDLNRLPQSVQKVVCAADVSVTATPAQRNAPLIAALTGADSTSTFDLSIPPDLLHPAMICFELYRRNDRWKVRAVAQGYAGGRTALLRDYGLDDAAEMVPSGDSAPTTSPASSSSTIGSDPLERIWMMYEDAARSAAGFTAAHDYAAARLDDELSAAVADPTTRNSEIARRAATAAHARHDDLLARARSAYEADAAHLNAELQELTPLLPPSMAPWNSAVWKSPAVAPAACDAVRLGELCADDVGPLRLPFCVPAPLRRPLWIGAGDSAAAVPVVAALVLRLLAATPSPRPELDVVDISGALQSLRTQLAPFMPREAICDHRQMSSGLERLVAAMELTQLSADGEHRVTPANVVVLSDFGFGFDHGAVEPLARLVSMVDRGHLSVVVIGDVPDDEDRANSLGRHLFSLCQYVPVGARSDVADPWTGGRWQFAADALVGDWNQPLSVLARLTSG